MTTQSSCIVYLTPVLFSPFYEQGASTQCSRYYCSCVVYCCVIAICNNKNGCIVGLSTIGANTPVHVYALRDHKHV